MRIAYAIESTLRYGGGVSMVVRTLMESLPDSYRFVLISRDAEGSLNTDSLSKRIEVHIPWVGGKDAPHPEFYRARRESLDRLVATQPDLVHFHSGGVYSWGNRWPGASWPAFLKKRNIPSVWTNHLVVDRLHGFCGQNKPRWLSRLLWPIARCGKKHQIQSVEKEVCVSDENAQKLRAWFPAEADKIQRVYHSRIDGANLTIPSKHVREKMILNVGHLAFRKGQHVLTEAFCLLAASHPDWQLIFIGPGECEEYGRFIKQLSERHGLSGRVHMLGQQESTADWLGKCSIFVQPSFQEGLPLALQEAMAAGCPTVATRIAGNPELVVDGETGFLIPAGDVNLMKDKLGRLMNDPQGRLDMGRKGFNRVVELGMTAQEMVKNHEGIYTKATRRNFS